MKYFFDKLHFFLHVKKQEVQLTANIWNMLRLMPYLMQIQQGDAWKTANADTA